MGEIAIRCEGSDFLTINILGRSHPACPDFWDGNWVRAVVEVSAGGFRGEVSGDLRAEELAAFAEQLARLQETLRGEAAFETMEGWLSIRAIGDGRGHVEFACVVRDLASISNTVATGNTLECVLATDQTFTRSTVAELIAVVQEFPVVGSADAEPRLLSGIHGSPSPAGC